MPLDLDTLTSKFSAALDGATPPTATETPASTPAVSAPPSESPSPATPPETSVGTQAPTPQAPTPPSESENVFPVEDEAEEFDFDAPKKPESASPAVVPPKPIDPLERPPEMRPNGELRLRSNRDREIYSTWKNLRDLNKPPEIQTDPATGTTRNIGGLGFVPTVEQIREFHAASQDLDMMRHELHSGEPEHARNWLRQTLIPDGEPSAGQLAAAQALADTAASNPAIYQAMARPFVGRFVEELYERASNASGEDRKYFTSLARDAEFYLTGGKVRDLPKGWLEASAPDPLAQREQSLLQREQALTTRQQQEQQQRSQALMSALGDQCSRLMSRDIDRAMEIDGAPSSRGLKALAKEFYSEVFSALNASGSVLLQNYRQLQSRAIRSGSPADIEAAAVAWRDAARPIVRQLRSQYLQEARRLLVSESQNRIATAESAAARPSGMGVSQPPAPPSQQAPQRQPGETTAEFRERMLRDRFAAVIG